MKKITTTFLCVLMFIVLHAQVIPNYNFENWSLGPDSSPDYWNAHGSNIPGYVSVTRSTQHANGQYSVRLENKITVTDTAAGVVDSKRPNGQEGLGSAFPVNIRYTSLKGYYKYAPMNGDSAQVFAALFKSGYVNSQTWGNLVAFAFVQLPASATFIPFTTGSFAYDNANTVLPDSAWVGIHAFREIDVYASSPGKLPVLGNSVMYADALNFDTFISGVESNKSITSNFKLFPTINKGNFQVNFETEKPAYSTMILYDLEGRELKRFFSGNLDSGIHSFSYSVNDLSNGTYMFMLSSVSGYRVEKIQIQK